MRLGVVIKKYRRIQEVDIREVAKEIGISAPTLMRIEHGRDCDAQTLRLILNWLMDDPEPNTKT